MASRRKKKPPLSTVVAFMSDETQAQIEEQTPDSTLLPLDSILPDFDQPRRLLPNDLAEAVAGGHLSPVEAIQAWLNRAEQDKADTALHRNIHELKRLADSIERHGLISPISVRQPRLDEIVPAGVEYLIVTGERRYWAHVYLVSNGRQIQEGETIADPADIKVTFAPPGVTVKAHQLIENLLREDINAIEKARGLWALRYEMSGVNYSSPQIGDDMVNYSSPSLIPWARVEETLGISKRYRIFVISVLKLCEEAQAIVEAHKLAEMTIRPIVQKLKDNPELQVQALKQLVTWQAENEADEGPGRSIVASVKQLVDKLLAGEVTEKQVPASKSTRSVSSAPVIRFRGKVRQTLDFLNRLKSEDKVGLTEALNQNEFADLMIDLRNLRQQIDTLLEVATKAQPASPKMSPLPPIESDE